MKVYVFGNKDLVEDDAAFKVAEKLRKDSVNVQFVEVKPNEDLPFSNGEDVVVMDVVEGLDPVILSEAKDLDSSGRTPQNDERKYLKISIHPMTTAHDFDLGFQLKYLKKLGKLGNVIIIGIPQNSEVGYDSIHSIFKKLVAQDMQGS